MSHPISPAIKAEAAAWIARLHADARNVADERAFRVWLAAHPDHAAAFEAVTAVWDVVGGIDHQTVRTHTDVKREPAFSRRNVLASVGAIAVAMAGVTTWRSAYAGVYETDVGEQKHLALPDGTQVFLDTDTRIRAQFDNQVRSVTLERGRANFRVDADPARPFIVDAATQRIITTTQSSHKNEASTAMDIRRDGDTVSVVLIRGRATVVTAGESKVATLEAQSLGNALGSGERAVIAPAAAPQLDRPNLTPLLAWQSGQAVFENETLADAVKEMNRYSAVKLAITEPSVASLRLSGVYRVGDNAAFARSVSTLLRVEMRRVDGQFQLLAQNTK